MLCFILNSLLFSVREAASNDGYVSLGSFGYAGLGKPPGRGGISLPPPIFGICISLASLSSFSPSSGSSSDGSSESSLNSSAFP